MKTLPPRLTPSDFKLLDTAAKVDIERHFAPKVAQFRDFLNGIHPLQDVQTIRRVRPGSIAFRRDARCERQHWWFSHEGGRSEAQWNVGMFPCHLRFGIGFNRGGGGYADVAAVEHHLDCFCKALESHASRGVLDGLEAEVYNHTDELRIQSTAELLSSKNLLNEEWIFIGLLLRSGIKTAFTHLGCDKPNAPKIPEDTTEFAAELKRVAIALWEPWKDTMACARR